MADFSHLHNLDVQKDRTAVYELYQLAGEQSLTLSPAGESNKGYFNALLRKTGKVQRGKNRVNAHTLKEQRDEDRVLYSKFIVMDWNVVDASGESVPFSEADALAFLKSLPDWIFDDIRAFASNLDNFIDEPIEVEDKAKN